MNENQENTVKEVKQETVKTTFREARESIKKEAEVGKGLLKNLWKNPIETIKEIAEDKENKTLKTALILVAIWTTVALLNMILFYATNKWLSFNFLSTLKVMLEPVLTVLAMTLSIYVIKDRAKDSISNILTSVTVAYIPSMIAALLWLLEYISIKMTTILSPISSLLRLVSIVLMYHTVKELMQEDNESKAIKNFIKVEALFYVIVFLISFLGISL